MRRAALSAGLVQGGGNRLAFEQHLPAPVAQFQHLSAALELQARFAAAGSDALLVAGDGVDFLRRIRRAVA